MTMSSLCAICLKPIDRQPLAARGFKLHKECHNKMLIDNSSCRYKLCLIYDFHMIVHPWTPKIHHIFSNETKKTIFALLMCTANQGNVIKLLPKDVLYLICAHVAAYQFELDSVNGYKVDSICSTMRCFGRPCHFCYNKIPLIDNGGCTSSKCNNPKGAASVNLSGAKYCLESSLHALKKAQKDLVQAQKNVENAEKHLIDMQLAYDSFG
jgi:hypothetical protein